jgi:endo-1,4-beta-mannosidase
LWEDFQPAPKEISFRNIKNLQKVLEIAESKGLQILITLFTGHMSGVNWVPIWALSKEAREPGAYRTITLNRSRRVKIGYFYRDSFLLRAQSFLIRKLVPSIRKYPSLYGWDLGNEPSILLKPRTVKDTVFWAKTLSSELKKLDPQHPITLGIHQGDLMFDTKFHPHVLSPYLDLFSMHGYPNYSDWAKTPTDSKALAFLNFLTEQMAKKKVFFTEFGLPVRADPVPTRERSAQFYTNQEKASRYFKSALNQLHRIGSLGALVWCFSDYHPDLKLYPPFDRAPHELYFGITKWNGDLKKTAKILRYWSTAKKHVVSSPAMKQYPVGKYFQSPEKNLSKSYKLFLTKK